MAKLPQLSIIIKSSSTPKEWSKSSTVLDIIGGPHKKCDVLWSVVLHSVGVFCIAFMREEHLKLLHQTHRYSTAFRVLIDINSNRVKAEVPRIVRIVRSGRLVVTIYTNIAYYMAYFYTATTVACCW